MATLFVCSGGGHLKQLQLLRPRLGLAGSEVVWATFDTALSRSLLTKDEVVFIPYASPRDLAGTLRNANLARRLLRRRPFGAVISTGANPAVSFFLPARILGIPCHYIESATRTRGPSMTGRLLGLLPGVHLYTQYPKWATRRWLYRGSIFDNFVASPAPDGSAPIRRVVVTVGTNESYGFRRLFERLADILPADLEVLWQTGVTDTSNLSIRARQTVPAADLEAALRQADVVVAHAGTGSALAALEAGKCPILIPRQVEYGEHIDNHQADTAAELERRGLAVVRSAERLTMDDLRLAQRIRVEAIASLPPIPLVSGALGRS
jgi:UDP-N-acetylglucosamine transferase subunit ALG13